MSNGNKSGQAVIIGAGPAGLTAAYELLTRTDVVPIVLEKSTYMGGIARTYNYKGNRIDLGGHRFFSKSDRVMRWWLDRMPLQATGDRANNIAYHGMQSSVQSSEQGPDPELVDNVMLLRQRQSRIYFLRQFFKYPITLNKETLARLGFRRVLRIGCSYLWSALFPPKSITTLEQFFISRFGKELYLTFFKSYTEKVWGVPCNQISAEWGAQRVKGLSVTQALLNIVKKRFQSKKDIAQKNVETSLIEQFLYPKFGPGQMWEEVADAIRLKGGQILTECDVETISAEDGRVVSVTARDKQGQVHVFKGDYFFSTMPVKELIRSFAQAAPADVRAVSEGLVYRDFLTVGLLLNAMLIGGENGKRLLEDNWIYIQEPDVLAGRLQIFNNWSPYMVADPAKIWVGVEYFCNEHDSLWEQTDQELCELAATELEKLGLIRKSDVVDRTVMKMPKAYPAYFGTYDQFDKVRAHLDNIPNLFLIGRNGMHKYNNQDHSMLTAMIAVDNIAAGITSKANLWDVNTESDYHESKETAPDGNGAVREALPQHQVSGAGA